MSSIRRVDSSQDPQSRRALLTSARWPNAPMAVRRRRRLPPRASARRTAVRATGGTEPSGGKPAHLHTGRRAEAMLRTGNAPRPDVVGIGGPAGHRVRHIACRCRNRFPGWSRPLRYAGRCLTARRRRRKRAAVVSRPRRFRRKRPGGGQGPPTRQRTLVPHFLHEPERQQPAPFLRRYPVSSEGPSLARPVAAQKTGTAFHGGRGLMKKASPLLLPPTVSKPRWPRPFRSGQPSPARRRRRGCRRRQ